LRHLLDPKCESANTFEDIINEIKTAKSFCLTKRNSLPSDHLKDNTKKADNSHSTQKCQVYTVNSYFNDDFLDKQQAKSRHVTFADKYDFGKNDLKSFNSDSSKIKIDKDQLIQKILQNNSNSVEKLNNTHGKQPNTKDVCKHVEIPMQEYEEIKKDLKSLQNENRELKK
jgi:hypothetical protein